MTAAPIVGTAGWSLPRSMEDRFHVAGTHLQRYGAVLDGVEINSSFYRPHRRETYLRWADSVPDAFRFAVKVPRSITHERRLASCEDLIERFAGEVAGLGGKLGPLLVQLPPSLGFEAAIAVAVFEALAGRLAAPIVCEPRHAGWFTAKAAMALSAWGVARVAADPAPVPDAGEPGGAGTLVYVRLHGSPTIYVSDYGDRIAGLARRLARYAARGVQTWCIFDNTALGHAMPNALALRDLSAPRPSATVLPP